MDAEKTIVVFRKFREGGDIIALFPEIAGADWRCMSYMHVGQHSEDDYNMLVGGRFGVTIPAQEHEYADLKAELERIGYNLDVRMKRPVKKARRG